MMNSTMENKRILPWNKILKIVLPTITILALWDIIAIIIAAAIEDKHFMPSVRETASALIKIITSKSFLKVLFTAFFRVISGLLLGIIIGVILAAVCHKYVVINTVLSPIISIMKATPVACIIVLLWILLNDTEISVFVVVIMVLPIVWQNVYDAYNAIDKSLIEVADVFKLDRVRRLKVLVVPTVLSYLLPAIITSIGLAWKAEIAAEIMTNSNIGELIYDFKTVSWDYAPIFSWTVIIVTFSIIFEKTAKHFLGRLANEFKNQ